MLRKFVMMFLSLVACLFGVSAFAAGPDMSSLTTAIDFGTVTVAVLAAASALAVVYVAWKGASMVLGAIRRG